MNYTKVIPTKYKGYTFRSRLEARWAVYFDLIGITWDYEPEGYVLRNGVWYLPDFYLHQLDTFVEIKPQPEIYGCEDAAKSRLFVSGRDYRDKWFPFSIDHALWVKYGLPNNDSDYLLYGNGGKVQMGYHGDDDKADLWMGEYYCEDVSLYCEHQHNFVPEKAYYFEPQNDVHLFDEGSNNNRDWRFFTFSWNKGYPIGNAADIAKSYKFQRI